MSLISRNLSYCVLGTDILFLTHPESKQLGLEYLRILCNRREEEEKGGGKQEEEEETPEKVCFFFFFF